MRFTKGRLAGCTIDGIARRRLRLADFLLNKCFLNALARLILPLPVMVKVFLALECVLTLGITIQIWDGKGSSFYFSCKFYFKYFSLILKKAHKLLIICNIQLISRGFALWNTSSSA